MQQTYQEGSGWQCSHLEEVLHYHCHSAKQLPQLSPPHLSGQMMHCSLLFSLHFPLVAAKIFIL
ncbi:hypothetical protein E2C01_090538 [Portunus trituberculatus]|uniref:Uncharacterized protein n=1 Tax=Portunus trituberculatus TaxID=210409 RepID=A0A5B7JBN4_PORTR|nr:hypothetical protein [Portunus trituberculatus]